MLLNFNDTAAKIESGRLLHISGTEDLLKKLPKGNWIGGSTEYFMTKDGGKVTNNQLFVTELAFDRYKISVYDESNVQSITLDAYDNGFSIVILPFDSAVHKTYADKAPEFEGMFMKNIAGWVSGLNLGASGQTPIAVNGQAGEAFAGKAVALHIGVPDGKTVGLGIVNIFEQDESSPLIEFSEEGFSAAKCTIDGKEQVLADYIAQNNIDTKFPLVGDYSGVGINISFKSIENGVVNFYAPVFPDIQYRMAKPLTNYVEHFNDELKKLKNTASVFSCNCILNFLYGEMEGKNVGFDDASGDEAFLGPITFGEVAYQLVNQTLVYVTVS
jgi:hypothetical protein